MFVYDVVVLLHISIWVEVGREAEGGRARPLNYEVDHLSPGVAYKLDIEGEVFLPVDICQGEICFMRLRDSYMCTIDQA